MAGRCQVCGQGIGPSGATACPVCETPHHEECWQWVGRCSIYGCAGQAAGEVLGVDAVRLETRGAALTGPAALAATHRGYELDVHTLAKLLKHADVAVRRAAAAELSERELAARAVADALLAALRDEDEQVREHAIAAIAKFPHVALEDMDLVLDTVQDGSFDASCGRIVAHVGPLAARLTPKLIQVLDDPRGGHWASYAIDALIAIGPKARDAVPAVVRAAHHRNEVVRGHVAKALAALGATDAVQLEIARELMEDSDPLVRAWTMDAISWLGLRALPLKKLCVLELERGSSDPRKPANFDRRWEIHYAVHLLGGLGRHASDCTDLIARVGKTFGGAIEREAEKALRRIELAAAAS